MFHYFRVSKKFGYEGGGGVSGFYVETYLSHSAEIFRGEPFSVSLFSGTVKIYE